jgi:hypothetical protein
MIERVFIWIWLDDEDDGQKYYCTEPLPCNHAKAVEFVRADLYDALVKERDELVEAVLENWNILSVHNVACLFCKGFVIDGTAWHEPGCIVARYSKEKEND